MLLFECRFWRSTDVVGEVGETVVPEPFSSSPIPAANTRAEPVKTRVMVSERVTDADVAEAGQVAVVYVGLIVPVLFR